MNASSVGNSIVDAPAAADNARGSLRFSGGADFDVIILGAGASGLFCAREAARLRLRVLLLEGGEQAGLKLCLSGGGRANFTNLDVEPRHYRCARPRFCGPALKGFTPRRMLDLVVGEWRLPYEEREHGQLFLTVPARRLRDALADDCRAAGCRLVCHAPVSRAWREGEDFCVAAGDGLWKARGLVIALGGPAWPQAGATDAGLRLAGAFGHEIVPPRPALVPLRMPAGWPSADADCNALAGISLPVRVDLPQSGLTRDAWTDSLLFTHDGLSGPAALKASLFWNAGEALRVNFAPDADVEALIDAPENGRTQALTVVRRLMPQRLADALTPPGPGRRKCAELSRAHRRQIADAVQRHEVVPTGVADFSRAEAASGGIDVARIHPKNMESALVPRLWCIGEALDVTGLLGGYNLHWAWASAAAAARHMARTLGSGSAGE